MVLLGCADHRGCDLCQKPCQRNLRHGNIMFLCQFRHTADDHIVLRCSGVIFQFRVAVLLETLRCFSGMSGKTAAGQRTVRRHGDVVLCAQFCHLSFLLPEDQIIMALNRHEFCESFFFRQCIGFCQLVGKAVGNTDISRFSGLDDPVQSVHDVKKGRLVVPHMVNVQIHIIDAEIFQACIDHLFNMLLSGNSGSDFLLRARQKLCRYNHILPLCKIPERTPYILFTGAALIADSGVKKINSKFQTAPDDLTGMFLVQGPAVLPVLCISKSHTSHTNPGHLQF